MNLPVQSAAPVDAGVPSGKVSTRRQIRGSSLLMVGRFLSIGVNFIIQVLTVRYLSTTEYDAFAYALSMSQLAETLVTMALDRAVTRFAPLYEERQHYARLFGTFFMLVGLTLSLPLALFLIVSGLNATLGPVLVSDPL